MLPRTLVQYVRLVATFRIIFLPESKHVKFVKNLIVKNVTIFWVHANCVKKTILLT